MGLHFVESPHLFWVGFATGVVVTVFYIITLVVCSQMILTQPPRQPPVDF